MEPMPRSIATHWLFLAVCASTAQLAHSQDVGDEVLSKIAYTSKKGAGRVLVGERGRVTEIRASGGTVYAICDFPDWSSAKLKLHDVARIGDEALGKFRVGDEVFASFTMDDGEYGSVRRFDSGVVLGRWDAGHVHCKFQGMRRKIQVEPSLIHLKVGLQPADLAKLAVLLLLGVPVLLAVWRRLPSLEPRLPGGFREHDRVMSVHAEAVLGLNHGDVGVVVGKSTVESDTPRVRCCFRSCKSLNIATNQIVKMGEPVMGPYCSGELVVSNILDGSVTLRNGSTLEHGKFGKVVRRSSSDEERVLCVFEGGNYINVLPAEIKSRHQHVEEAKASQRASKDIKKTQRREQKEALQALQGRESTEDEDVAEAFKCVFCMDLLLQPVTLRCGHTLCKDCVESWKAVCGHPFKSPCCARVLPYELEARASMRRDIAEAYPQELERRIADADAERGAQQAVEAGGEPLVTGDANNPAVAPE